MHTYHYWAYATFQVSKPAWFKFNRLPTWFSISSHSYSEHPHKTGRKLFIQSSYEVGRRGGQQGTSYYAHIITIINGHPRGVEVPVEIFTGRLPFQLWPSQQRCGKESLNQVKHLALSQSCIKYSTSKYTSSSTSTWGSSTTTSTSTSTSTSGPSTSTSTSTWHASTTTSTSTRKYLSTDQVPVPVPSTKTDTSIALSLNMVRTLLAKYWQDVWPNSAH